MPHPHVRHAAVQVAVVWPLAPAEPVLGAREDGGLVPVRVLADELAVYGYSVKRLLLATVTSDGFRQTGAIE